LYKCIAELPETDRIIISLELEEVKQAEIARLLASKYQSKIHRIKEKLTQNLKKMENNIDFKNLWKQQAVSPPNIEELLAKLKHFKKN
jgi:tRNA U34 5-carboxymethylaminomethyl modifying GTPase MnmE/TrmE